MCIPIMLLAVGCKKVNSISPSISSQESAALDYDLVIDKIISWDEALSQSLEKYNVYVYSLTCGHCREIKETVISKAIERNDIYFIEYSKSIPVSEDVSDTIGKNDITEIFILGTPTLLVVENGVLIDNLAGKNAILKAL